MNRRKLLEVAVKGAVGGVAMGVASACTTNNVAAPAATAAPAAANKPAAEPAKPQQPAAPAVTGPAQAFEWNLATSWPVSLDTIYGGAVHFAERVSKMTGGKFKITPRPAGDPQGSPALQVLDAVSQGGVQMGHTASYYYIGKSWVCALATGIPFGMNLQQHNAWLHEGGGLKLIQEVYGKKFNVINFPAGNTACQWGGWFSKEITKVDDLKGLKMRLGGTGSAVMTKLGVNSVTVAGGEIFQALQTKTIDAAEWVGPYDDEKLGFFKVVKVCHYPGWWEPAPTLDVMVNLNEWNKLPAEYKEIVQSAAADANQQMPARYDTKSPAALENLIKEGVTFKPFPADVMDAAKKATDEVMAEKSADADVKKVYDSYKAFQTQVTKFHSYAEAAMFNFQFGKK
ncbi:MAG: TRAP transporter substrate-binding protein DctP [Anaerolineae bacterium]|nr:TRAP transporter substrate-binding protein DctP [Anaerolineae bacterium]